MQRRHGAGSVLAWFAGLILLFAAAPAAAAVEISFYSHELGSSFPHAFVVLKGTLDRDGRRIDEDYGFTAKAVTPAILMGRVGGKIDSTAGPSYVGESDRQFTLTISDAEYDRVMATVAAWRDAKQPSYDLNSHNCVHFVAEIAGAIGMKAETPKKLMKKPRSYILSLVAANRVWLEERHADIGTLGAPAGKEERRAAR
jgi:hypothetical protein